MNRINHDIVSGERHHKITKHRLTQYSAENTDINQPFFTVSLFCQFLYYCSLWFVVVLPYGVIKVNII